jgi:hypothetical protein
MNKQQFMKLIKGDLPDEFMEPANNSVGNVVTTNKDAMNSWQQYLQELYNDIIAKMVADSVITRKQTKKLLSPEVQNVFRKQLGDRRYNTEKLITRMIEYARK